MFGIPFPERDEKVRTPESTVGLLTNNLLTNIQQGTAEIGKPKLVSHNNALGPEANTLAEASSYQPEYLELQETITVLRAQIKTQNAFHEQIFKEVDAKREECTESLTTVIQELLASRLSYVEQEAALRNLVLAQDNSCQDLPQEPMISQKAADALHQQFDRLSTKYDNEKESHSKDVE